MHEYDLSGKSLRFILVRDNEGIWPEWIAVDDPPLFSAWTIPIQNPNGRPPFFSDLSPFVPPACTHRQKGQLIISHHLFWSCLLCLLLWLPAMPLTFARDEYVFGAAAAQPGPSPRGRAACTAPVPLLPFQWHMNMTPQLIPFHFSHLYENHHGDRSINRQSSFSSPRLGGTFFNEMKSSVNRKVCFACFSLPVSSWS